MCTLSRQQTELLEGTDDVVEESYGADLYSCARELEAARTSAPHNDPFHVSENPSSMSSQEAKDIRREGFGHLLTEKLDFS